MHQALQISEVLRNTFHWCSKKSNVSNAVVCKLWQTDALDVVWEEIPDINHFFRFLGTVVQHPDQQMFDPPIASERWNLFQERYAWRVRKITCSNVQLDQHPLFNTISRLQHLTPAFPNLKVLIWHSAPGDHLGYTHPSTILMNPTLVRFELSITEQESPDALRQYMCAISRHMRALKRLHVTATRDFHNVDGIGNNLATLVTELPGLEYLSLPAPTDGSHLLSAISSRSHGLGTLHLTPYNSNIGSSHMSPLVDSSIPSQIKELSITIGYPTFTHFLRSGSNSFPHLTELSVLSGERESPSVIKDLLEVIASALPSIERVHILYSPSIIPDTSPPDASPVVTPEVPTPNTPVPVTPVSMAYIIHMVHIEPIIACTSITHFRITHPYPLALHQTDLERVALAWPALRSLVLCDDPAHDPPMYQDTEEFPRLGLLDALLPLARHCPLLEELRLLCEPNISGMPDEWRDTPPFRKLSLFSPGGRWCSGGDETIIPLAMALSHILPPGCEIRFASQWMKGRSRKRWNEYWNEVKRGRRYVEEIDRIKGSSQRWKKLAVAKSSETKDVTE